MVFNPWGAPPKQFFEGQAEAIEETKEPDYVRLLEQSRAKKTLEAEYRKRKAQRDRAKKTAEFKRRYPKTFAVDKFGREAQGRVDAFVKEKSDPVFREAGRFAGEAQQQEVSFSQEQEMLRQMFGGGSKIWGLGPMSETQVNINHDLNPSMRGDMGTARLFGF